MQLKHLVLISSMGFLLAGCTEDEDNSASNAPTVSSLSIKGMGSVNTDLEASFTLEGTGTPSIQWLISDTREGVYTPLSSSEAITLTEADLGKYVKLQVTGICDDGTSGTPAQSAPVGPVDVNIITNPGFDNHGMGWTYHYSNFRSDNDVEGEKAYQGENRGRIAIGADYGIKQTVTIPETGYYNLSAYVSTTDDGSILGLQTLTGENLTSTTLEEATPEFEYKPLSTTEAIALEKGEVLNVFLTGAQWSYVNVDNVKLAKTERPVESEFNQILDFTVDGQSGLTGINRESKTIHLSVPYNTDMSDLTVHSLAISENSTSSIDEGQSFDCSVPYEVSLFNTQGNESSWQVSCSENEKEVAITSSNPDLEEAFNWAIAKTDQFVMTDKNGLINRDENNNDGDGRDNYIPSYWAGYFDRTAFYSRDFLHQASGAKLAGLDNENYSMFHTFALNSTESRKWYTLWAINFNGSAHTIDYHDDDWFVREVPAQFEFVEKAYEQYLWTGDQRYIRNEELWNFYTKVVTEFIGFHDTLGNGVAEGKGGIFEGAATYNERGEFPIEAGDGIGSQYQAFVAYAGMLEARGESIEAAIWRQKAADLKTYFNEEWSYVDGNSDPLSNYVNIVQLDGVRLNDFGKENSWFMPMKLITEPGPRNERYLDFISENLGEGIGSTPESPWNIEAYTYLPETFFPYNRNEEAWKWMQYIIDEKDKAHERPTQGTNGDYPEISFTFISNTVEGLMGIEPNAPDNSVVTASRLPTEVQWLAVDYLPMGDHELAIRHDGTTQTKLTNTSIEPLTWEARFYGNYPELEVNGISTPATQKEVNGVTVSFVTPEVLAGETMTVSIPATL